MRIVAQRVAEARVTVEGKSVGEIGRGLSLLVGVGRQDEEGDISWLAAKIAGLRIFPDEEERLNLSVLDIGGSILAVSQFTLHADCRKGRRPSFVSAAPFEEGLALFTRFVQSMRDLGLTVETGMYGADMRVELLCDGPVTILLDSKDR